MRKKTTYNSIFVALMTLVCAICVSCTDELVSLQVDPSDGFTIVGEPVEAYLNIAVGGLTIDTGTRAEEPTSDYDGEDTEDERHVDDIWVFEYDKSSNELIYYPQRISIEDQSELVSIPITLSDNNGSDVILYVVANAGSGVESNSEEWVSLSNDSYPGFMTISDLEKNTIPTPHPQRMTWNETTGKYVLDSQDASNVSIPMAGCIETEVVRGEDILVPVERMFAKLMVKVDMSGFDTTNYSSAWLNTIIIGNIPEYCTVGTLWDGDKTNDAKPADYKDCESWLQRRFTAIGESNSSTGLGSSDGDTYPYIIYVPENIQGESQVDSSTDKAVNVPNEYALTVTAGIYVQTVGGVTQGEYTSYVAYPGGNNTTNFNVRRNCLYRVNLKINELIDNIVPSANCIICFSGEETAFWPYCREETGGGYDFTDYLDAYGNDDSKKIASVGIIWQSTNGGNTVDYSSSATGYIGDNSQGEYVWIDDVDDDDVMDEYHRRIHVKIPSGNTGNALIGAYNNIGDIIWSWHIWSRARENDPTTVNTKLYYTYDWDSSAIYGRDSGRPRVAGYTIMNCNLGAMQDDPDGSIYATSGAGNGETGFENARVTFGTLYQWGRKDPFPPITAHLAVTNYGGSSTGDEAVCGDYSTENIGRYFDNSNQEVTIVSTGKVEGALFYSVPGSNRTEFTTAIPNSIKNPTVFYAGTKDVNQKTVQYIAGTDDTSNNKTYMEANYPTPVDGNWMLDSEGDHFNRLWGGLDPELDSEQITKSFNTGYTSVLGSVTLYDDYGEKSIFDPCPYGWRVSPPDLWAGFTDTGLNPVYYTDRYDLRNINYVEDTTKSNYSGMTMYLTDWRTGPTSFFPIQGTRAPDGCAYRVGQCGNYNNATADANDRVNTLHVHYYGSLFHLYELIQVPYFIKSSAGPVRCVRIDSVQQQ